MRAHEPDREGHVDRDGVRIEYEVHGSGDTTIVLIPGWALPGRSWKAQVPYLSRHLRVVVYDPRGTGRSDRPTGTAAYSLAEHTADTLAVMDAVGADSVILCGKSRGAQTAFAIAAEHPERVEGVILAAPFIPVTPWPPTDLLWATFDEPSVSKRRRQAARSAVGAAAQFVRSPALRHFGGRVNLLEATATFSRQGMYDDFDGFAQWFNGKIVATEKHSTKQLDDLVGWLTATGPQAAADAFMGDCVREPAEAHELCARVHCPVLVIHGTEDLTVPYHWGKQVAELVGARLFTLPGAGHLPGGRYPVVVNLAMREFIDAVRDESARNRTGAVR